MNRSFALLCDLNSRFFSGHEENWIHSEPGGTMNELSSLRRNHRHPKKEKKKHFLMFPSSSRMN